LNDEGVQNEDRKGFAIFNDIGTGNALSCYDK